MATQNVTKSFGRHKKRAVSVFYGEVDISEAATSDDVYQLAVLPEKSLVVGAQVVIATANDAGTSAVGDLGVDGSNQFLNNGDLTGVAETVLVGTANDPTYFEAGGVLTWLPTYAGTAPTTGKVRIAVEYIETDKVTGDLTNFSAT